MGRIQRAGLLALIVGAIAVVGVAGWTLLPSLTPDSQDLSNNQSTPTDEARSASADAPSSPDSTEQDASASDGKTSTDSEAAPEAQPEASDASDPSTATSETTDETPPTSSSAEPQTPSAQASSQPQPDEGTAEPDEAPSDAEAPNASSSTSSDGSSSTASSSSAPSTEETQPVGVVERGELALEIDGDRFSEETYELTRREDGTHRLRSEGTFSVPVMVADVTFDYTQTIRLASAWQPRGYAFDLNGPLGFGNRHIEAEFDASSVRVTQGDADEPKTYQLERTRSAVIGMLASYTLLPKLLGDAESAKLSTMVVSFRGEDGPSDDNLAVVSLTVQRGESTEIVDPSRDETLSVTHLTMTFNANAEGDASPPLDIYVQDDRFLALYGRFSQDSPPFRIYDMERFPKGFSVPADASASGSISRRPR